MAKAKTSTPSQAPFLPTAFVEEAIKAVLPLVHKTLAA
jgi:hypothetical protein